MYYIQNEELSVQHDSTKMSFTDFLTDHLRKLITVQGKN